MKKIALLLLFLIPIPTFADDRIWRYYVGVHANTSSSRVFDGNIGSPEHWFGWSGVDSQPVYRIDDGGIRSNPSFSITAGAEQRRNDFGLKNIKLLIGGELFFDHINNTIIQGDQTWRYQWPGGGTSSFVEHRGNAGEPIHRTNFVTGIRGKFGVNLYNRLDLYGSFGLAYWDREYLLDIAGMRTGGGYWGNLWDWMQVMPVSPQIGFGAKFHATDNWAINANYTRMLPVLYDAPGHNFANRRVSVGLDIFTLGILYYF